MNIELRTDSVIIEGYVNAVERESKVLKSQLGDFVEVIKSNAFKRSLQRNPNVDLLLNHDTNKKLGSTREGNLELYEDNIGLKAKCEIRDSFVISKARNNQLRGWSFGFISKDDTVDALTTPKKRYVNDLDLFEVSIIDDRAIPAYTANSIEMREGKEYLKEVRTFDFEKSSRDINCDKYKKILEELRSEK